MEQIYIVFLVDTTDVKTVTWERGSISDPFAIEHSVCRLFAVKVEALLDVVPTDSLLMFCILYKVAPTLNIWHELSVFCL